MRQLDRRVGRYYAIVRATNMMQSIWRMSRAKDLVSEYIGTVLFLQMFIRKHLAKGEVAMQRFAAMTLRSRQGD